MRLPVSRGLVTAGMVGVAALWGAVALFGQDDPLVKTEPIAQVIQRTQAEKPTFASDIRICSTSVTISRIVPRRA